MLKDNVLRKQKDFDSVYKRGKSVVDRYVVIFYKKNNLGHTRTGILASKKVGNAVQRNRARRLIRLSYNNISQNLSEGYDYVVIARNTISDKKQYEVETSLKSAFRRAGLLKRQ